MEKTMYHHHAATSQNAGVPSYRQRQLSELMVVCNLSRKLGNREPYEAMLDRLAHHVIELVPVAFSSIVTRESDGSFVCRAGYRSQPTQEVSRKNQPVLPPAWPFYQKAIIDKNPTTVSAFDPNLNSDQRRALGLDEARRLWLFPLCTSKESVGILVIGEKRNGTSRLFGSGLADMINSIADQAALAIHHARRTMNLEESFIKIILAIAEAIDAADPDSHNHGYRTANLAVELARRLNFSEQQVETIRLAAVLHDIGKVEIADEILRKPGPLTPSEWEIMRKHPITGAEILAQVNSLSQVASIIRSHHEKFDGSGYPYGLKGEQIPLEARILAVADAYSVMVNGRVYRKALTQPEAVAELQRCSGTHFDPQVVQAMMELFERGVIG
jgi:putative nucleotidyltransferase with HDIG domain